MRRPATCSRSGPRVSSPAGLDVQASADRLRHQPGPSARTVRRRTRRRLAQAAGLPCARCSAGRVLPTPPGPVRVSRRVPDRQQAEQASRSVRRPISAVVRRGEVAAGPEVGVLETQRRVVAEDRRVQFAQRGPGVQTGVLGQARATVGVHLQRLGLPSRPVQSEHQVAAQVFAERVPAHQTLEVRDQVAVVPEGEQRASPEPPGGPAAARSRRAASGSMVGTSRRSCQACPSTRERRVGSRHGCVVVPGRGAARGSPRRAPRTRDVERPVGDLEPVGPADGRQSAPCPARSLAGGRRRTPGGCAPADPGHRPARARRPGARPARCRARGRAAPRAARAAWPGPGRPARRRPGPPAARAPRTSAPRLPWVQSASRRRSDGPLHARLSVL